MSGSKKETSKFATIAFARMPLRDFFNLVAHAMFPDEWRGHFVDAPSGDSKGSRYAEVVRFQLDRALELGFIPVEVDLSRLPAHDRCWAYEENEEELLYYPLSAATWKSSASRLDWVSGTVVTNPEEFYPPNPGLAGVLGGTWLKLNGHVKDPAGVTANLFKGLVAQVGHDKLVAAQEHMWGEITAVMWRHIACNNLTVKHGFIEELASQVRAYYASDDDPDEKKVPSLSQLREAARLVRDQMKSRSVQEAVIPNFSQLRKNSRSKAKGPLKAEKPGDK